MNSTRPKGFRFCPCCGGTQEQDYSAESVARMEDCSVETVRGWVRERKIGSIKVGGLRRIPAESLEKFKTRIPSIDELTDEALLD